MAKTLLVDFDGVIHSYKIGWQGAAVIPDPPVPGAIEWLRQASKRFSVCVYSSRTHQDGGVEAMRNYLLRHGMAQEELEQIAFPEHKPPAHMTIDDRALCFTGEWPDLDLIDAFQPWNRGERFPRGQLNGDDEGALAVKVSSSNGTIRIDFNKPVAWLGLGAHEARAMAAALMRHADTIEN
jgi:hypothetical protein